MVTDMPDVLQTLTDEIHSLRETIASQRSEICKLTRNIDALNLKLRKRDREIEQLKSELSKHEIPPKDSGNGSTPPSKEKMKDEIIRRTKTLRKPTGRKPGGQEGHEGSTLNILEGLNDRQKEAVTTIDGRIKVVAGAGSGKTKALTHRYAYLVEEVGVNPANILCLTFTNKAAQEMKQRIAKMVHTGNYNDFVSTIHGFCVKFLRQEIYRIGYPQSFTIIDEEDMKVLAKEVMDITGESRQNNTVQEFLKNISMQKGIYVDCYVADKFISGYVDNYLVSDNARICKEANPAKDDTSSFALFIKKQQKAFSLDFQDLINVALYILEVYPEVREKWQNHFDYIMLDEAQDCNRNDWRILNILSELKNNLFIVGDPDQAIYEWRGARPSLFTHFVCDTQVILDENYRSAQQILDVANSVIGNNKDRIQKDLFTKKNTTSEIIHFHGKNEFQENEWVVKKIESLHKQGFDYSDVSILYRASFLSRGIEQELMKKQIPYIIYGGIRFFERKEIKDALSYLRLLTVGDDLSFLRILNTPSRKLGDVYKKKLRELAELEGTTLYQTLKNHIDEAPFNKDSAKEFVRVIEETKEKVDVQPISEILQDILRQSGYEQSLRVDDDKDRLENLQELQSSIIAYENANMENEVTLSSYLQDIALYTNMDYKESPDGVVKLMTMHQAKGLEFPYVFVIGLTEGTMPNHRAIRERGKAALEEERRLMYVAITRAEKALYLTESEGYNYTLRLDKYPSRFITEIKRDFFVTEGAISEDIWNGTKDLISRLDEELNPMSSIKFRENSIVQHKIFGKGTIMSYNEEQNSYQVKFENGLRTIVASKLEPVTED